MSDWSKVRWTQARQIAELMEMPPLARPEPDVTPERWLATQVEQGDLAGAVTFLGHALPRYEAVAWASAAILPKVGGTALAEAIRRWLDGAEDSDRRTVWRLAEDADEDSPERLLGYAVFFSGGSIAPEDQAPVNPDPALCGRFAAAAIIKAAHRDDDPDRVLAAAITAGEGYARGDAA